MPKHATKKDAWLAVLVTAVTVLLEANGYVLLKGSEWLVKLGLVALVLVSLSKGYPLVALMLAILLMRYLIASGGAAYGDMWKTYDEMKKNDPRFASGELDIEMANGTLKMWAPRILAPPNPKGPLLLFPPGPEDLAKISSNSV